MKYASPIPLGSLVELNAWPAVVGRSSVMMYIEFRQNEQLIVSGYVTYVYLGEDGKPAPHGITVDAREEDPVQTRARVLQKAFHSV